MTLHSVLFERRDAVSAERIEAPGFFGDLNLDQIVDAVTAGKQDYNLKPFFYTPLRDADAIRYRQDVARDLENRAVLESINSFALKMITMNSYLAMIDGLVYKYHKEGWFIEAARVYCEAVADLARDLSLAHLESRGMVAFCDYLAHYVRGDRFTSLVAETQETRAALASVKYCVNIKGSLVQVRKYEDEIDYSLDVEQTFEKFKQGAVKDYRARLAIGLGMSHVEAQILDLVAKLYPDVFLRLDQYVEKNIHFLDETIRVFDREIQFYVAYLEYIARIRQAGLKFCYPQITASKTVYSRAGFDLALAHKCVSDRVPVISNDFYLQDSERIIVVSGPNQGGKTTFARMFGQLHYLACLGCPVPGREAQIFLFDRLFTHFEREEDIRNLRGKLQDDLVRIHAVLDQATPDSVIIMNEIFTSTTLQDAVFLGKEIVERILHLDSLCVCVTFIDELASLSEKTVSMVSTVVPDNPALRTFKIVRRPADGLAFAMSIAEKHRLTFDQVKERIKA